jgi:hypothetical protein
MTHPCNFTVYVFVKSDSMVSKENVLAEFLFSSCSLFCSILFLFKATLQLFRSFPDRRFPTKFLSVDFIYCHYLMACQDIALHLPLF